MLSEGQPLTDTTQPAAARLPLELLQPLQRAFLVTDGTVTEFLEAYFLEPIEIRKLGTPPDRCDLIYRREVLLVGKVSQRSYVYARSTIWLERLELQLREGLLATDKGIGRLLREYRLETYRQILHYWSEPAAALAGPLGTVAEEPLLARTYDVYRQGQAIMRITEKFPAALFERPTVMGNGS